MALTQAFYDAVSNSDIKSIRIMMRDSLLVDLTFSDYYAMAKEAEKLDGLYDIYDGRPLEMDKRLWNDDYVIELRVQIIDNFSSERIKHLMEVIRYLRPAPASPILPDANKKKHSRTYRKESDYQQQKRIDQQSGDYRGSKIVCGTAVGAAVGAVVATVAGVTVAGGAVVGAVLGGTAATIITMEGKNDNE